MGPSEFYNFVLSTVEDMVGDPVAVDLAAPTVVCLGSPVNPQQASLEADQALKKTTASLKLKKTTWQN
jgi:hypothetical protein